MKRNQWIVVAVGVALVAIVYSFASTIPPNKNNTAVSTPHNQGVSADSIIAHAKASLTPEQVTRLAALEQTVKRGNVKEQQLEVYHQLAHFWQDSARFFEPYAWYEAEAARLENSEKSLTFAAHLFLENLRGEGNPVLQKWKAEQAADLFERSLKINPENDSSKIGLGACYIYGNLSDNPMEGILSVRAIADKDSTNLFAQETLGYGSIISGQYDKAIERFQTVYRLTDNKGKRLEAALIIADAFEKKGDVRGAIQWYRQSLQLVSQNPGLESAVSQRIEDLQKKQ